MRLSRKNTHKKKALLTGVDSVSHREGLVKHCFFYYNVFIAFEDTFGGMKMRVMAIDYGDARTGVAISDAAWLLAGYTTVIQSRDPDRAAEEIAKLARERQADELVMGFPRNMDGTEGPRAELYRAFAALVEESAGMPVRLWDERRTTIEAHQILHASGKKMKAHKKNVDAVAASLILEGYLTWRARNP